MTYAATTHKVDAMRSDSVSAAGYVDMRLFHDTERILHGIRKLAYTSIVSLAQPHDMCSPPSEADTAGGFCAAKVMKSLSFLKRF